MEALVDDLLTATKHGSVVTDPDRTDIGVVIRTVWETTGKQSPDATLRTEDADRLCQLFENCFQNAIEHGGAAVTVRVGLLDTGFYIEDDGPGIPPLDYGDEWRFCAISGRPTTGTQAGQSQIAEEAGDPVEQCLLPTKGGRHPIDPRSIAVSP